MVVGSWGRPQPGIDQTCSPPLALALVFQDQPDHTLTLLDLLLEHKADPNFVPVLDVNASFVEAAVVTPLMLALKLTEPTRYLTIEN